MSRDTRLSRAAGGVAALALCAAIAGCGSSEHAQTSTAALAAQTTPAGTSVLQAPPITDAALSRGSQQHRIDQTIVAFYRAAWQDNASEACGLFSASGRAGFLHAAAVSFPQSMNKYSTCEHAMEIYNATLTDSAQTTVENDPSFSTAWLSTVAVQDIRIDGDSATAIAPTNVAELINPKQLSLVRSGSEWRISASKSLNASNLKKILGAAAAKGLLKPKGKH
jgi:hypothetical protein